MKITSKQINEIAQQLESGMKVFINRETPNTGNYGLISALINMRNMFGSS